MAVSIWLEALLVVGMVALLQVVSRKSLPVLATSHLVVAVAFAPVVGRRMIFGAPDRGVMKKGALWSLLGIVGLLALLLGAGTACVGIWGLTLPDSPKPVAWAILGGGLAVAAFGALLDRVRFSRDGGALAAQASSIR